MMLDFSVRKRLSSDEQESVTDSVRVYWPYFLGSNNPISYLFRELSVHFDRDRFAIRTFAVGDGEQIPPRITTVPSADFYTWRGRLNALRYSLRQYDLLHTGGIPMLHSPVTMLVALRNPGVSHVHTYRVDVDPTSDRFPTGTRRRLGARADVTTAVSQHTADTVREAFGFEPRVIYNGVDTDWFHPDYETPAVVRGLEHNRPVFLYVGTFEERKHPRHITRVARQLSDVTFLVIGGGEGHGREATIEREMAETENVHYAGKMDKERLPSIYSAVDGFLFPSIREGCSNAVLEALSSGTPVVGYEATSMPELVTHGETGYLAEPGDVDGLADGVERVLSGDADEFSRKARSYILANHSFETLAKQYQDAYFAALTAGIARSSPRRP